jgi:glycosyltransferase involved in cell wall biosynthesis
VRVLFATPAFWPAVAFGGPIAAARELTEGLLQRGHDVEVVTTGLRAIGDAPTTRFRTRRALVAGVPVTYVATPARYRWMGITPSLPLVLRGQPRPDVVHVFGFRDVVTTMTALWARAARIPYVFEPLGMFEPRLRKIRAKRALDATLYRSVWSAAAVVVAASAHERGRMAIAGLDAGRIEVRGNGFPDPGAVPPEGGLRSRLGLDGEPIVLYVGRLARGKGIEFLLELVAERPEVHVVLVGPDDGHGIGDDIEAAECDPRTAGRVHSLGEVTSPLGLYRDADVFVLASAGESFGMAAAEAAAAGTAIVVSDRCGVAEFLGDAALVVPYDRRTVVDAVSRLLEQTGLRASLGAQAMDAARRHSWATIVDRQVELYEHAIARHA